MRPEPRSAPGTMARTVARAVVPGVSQGLLFLMMRLEGGTKIFPQIIDPLSWEGGGCNYINPGTTLLGPMHLGPGPLLGEPYRNHNTFARQTKTQIMNMRWTRFEDCSRTSHIGWRMYKHQTLIVTPF